jgi:hypothetical protein
MRRALVAGLLVSLVGCVPMPPAPTQIAPQKLNSPLPPVEVVRRATAKLIDMGFDIALSDATGGVVQSKLARATPVQVTCRWPKGSIAAQSGVAILTLSINAIKDGEGSAVTITSRVSAEYPSLTGIMARAPNGEDCASNGSAERSVATAITGG